MKHLWAPWRLAYILADSAKGEECILCAFPAPGRARFRDHLILCQAPHAFVMMNKYPYNNGHVMVIPRRHASDPEQLSEAEYMGTMDLLRRATKAIRTAMSPHGFNVGMNLGRVAGAGIDSHCHYHIVPRWNGDTNFMPVLGETKVMGDHLVTSYERLLPFFAPLGEGPE
ncbi:MAG: HIT domain-containing protein [Deltaproteobacteria bacterium]|nr:HIT domain-containing protein [Deltaproteobacteria bacterium]